MTDITLELNNYQAINLHWLLRIAVSWSAGTTGVKCGNACHVCLNTGDWNSEILWQIEEAMMALDIHNKFNHNSPNAVYPEYVLSWEDIKNDYKVDILFHIYRLFLRDRINIDHIIEDDKSTRIMVIFLSKYRI